MSKSFQVFIASVGLFFIVGLSLPALSLAQCCKFCENSQACGDSCISNSFTCRQPQGCACDGSRPDNGSGGGSSDDDNDNAPSGPEKKKRTAGAITLSSDLIFSIDKISCGFVKNRWKVGRVLGNGKFLLIAKERKNLLFNANVTDGSESAKFAAIAGKLKKKQSKTQPICAVGPDVQYLFVTSSQHTGNLGGLDGADFICNQRAGEAGLPGVYKALLPTTNNSLDSRVAINFPVVNTKRKKLANNLPDLFDGKLKTPLLYNERGKKVKKNVKVWTASSFVGRPSQVISEGDASCSNWTSSDASMSARVGKPALKNGGWINQKSQKSACGASNSIYCLQQ